MDLDLRLSRAFRADDIRLADLEAVRTVLSGRSIIDAPTMHFRSRETVERFLRLLCYDVNRKTDRKRLNGILAASARYLGDQYGYPVPEELARPEDPVQPFLWASQPGPLNRPALMTVKAAHVINHVEARELRYRLPVSPSSLFELMRDRIRAFGHLLRSSGIDVVSLQAGEKTHDSLILKLLAKRQTIAAEVHDRIRCRVVIRRRDHILPTLLLMTRHLLPFNYVVPNESRNDLVSYAEMLEALHRANPDVQAIREAVQQERSVGAYHNEFSHPDFRMINFVVDVPLRVDRFARRTSAEVLKRYGRVVFLLVEFQLYDLQTFLRNELGPSSHAHYKSRQRRAILRRLVGAAAIEAWREPRIGGPSEDLQERQEGGQGREQKGDEPNEG